MLRQVQPWRCHPTLSLLLRNSVASAAAGMTVEDATPAGAIRSGFHSSASVLSVGASGSGTPHANLDEAASVASEAAGSPQVDICESLLSKLTDRTLLRSAGLIGGKWLGAWNGTRYEVRNPADWKVIATMPSMRADETRAAIAAADAVFPEWKRRTAKERGGVLRRWHSLILQHADDLATIMTTECGKPTAEAKAEVASGAASVEWFAEEGRRVCGDVLETVSADRRMLVLKQPIGVVAAITPWNFPMSMITRKVAPALAAGCTVVLKPAELTPLTAVALAELLDRAGCPDGVFNLVMGDAPAIGSEMVANEQVQADWAAAPGEQFGMTQSPCSFLQVTCILTHV